MLILEYLKIPTDVLTHIGLPEHHPGYRSACMGTATRSPVFIITAATMSGSSPEMKQ